MAGTGVNTLKNVAKQIRNVASAIAPRKTGNLRNALRQYNTPERMIKTDSKGDSTISFYVAPPAAKYGLWWNEPPAPVSKQRKNLKRNNSAHWDYGAKALKDPSVKSMMSEYKKALGKDVAAEIKKAVRALK